MTRRRITVSLIAAAATAMALVTPAQAAEAETEPGSVDLSSNLSSSAPADDEADGSEPGDDEENDGGETDENPQGNLGSLESTEEMELTFAILEAIMAVGTAATTGLVTYVSLVPGADDQVRNFLGQFGIQP